MVGFPGSTENPLVLTEAKDGEEKIRESMESHTIFPAIKCMCPTVHSWVEALAQEGSSLEGSEPTKNGHGPRCHSGSKSWLSPFLGM